MDVAQLNKMTRTKLIEVAKDLKMSGYSKLKKDELVELITANQPSKSKANPRKKTAPKSKQQIQKKEAVTALLDQEYKDTIEQSKYYVGEGIREQFTEEHFSFPDAYGHTRIVLMVRDPFWMYTYWEIAPDTIDSFRNQIGADRFHAVSVVLRVKNVTDTSPDTPHHTFDVDVPNGATNWYLNVPNDCATYVVELGYKTPDNEFFLVSRSNSIGVPRAGVSPVIDDKFTGEGGIGALSAEEYDQIYALSGGFSIGLSSGEIRELIKERLEQALSSGQLSSGASVGGISSGSGGLMESKARREKERGFFLVVNTELIVYGVTVPDATLTIQGNPKKLNPDGTFTARFSLPDGIQNIPVTAVSSDKIDTLTITPIVSKETK